MILNNSTRLEFGFGIGLDKEGVPISPKRALRAVNAIRDEACRLFGGCTILETQGAWRSKSGKVFVERGCTLFIFTDDDLETVSDFTGEKIKTLVSAIKVSLDQEAVFFSASLVKTQLF